MNYLQTWNQYLSEHKLRFPKLKTVDNNTAPAEDESAFMFDAVWTAALALNRTENRLRKENLTLTDFDYDDVHNISGMIYEEAINVKFFGLTVSCTHNYMLYTCISLHEAIVLLNLPIILSRISQKYYLAIILEIYPMFLKIPDLKSCYSILILKILASVYSYICYIDIITDC